MGFDDGEVILNNANHTYYTGQQINGVLKFQQDKLKKFRGIYVEVKGYCQVKWTTGSKRRVTHENYEEYINQKVYLVGAISGLCTLGIGLHEYSFSIQLPPDCPPSFEGDHGYIRYHLKVVVDRRLLLDQEKKIPLQVIAPVDLNLDPYCRHPVDMDISSSYCSWCMTSGGCELQVKAPHSGYCPDQSIPLDVCLNNHGSVSISELKLTIKEKITFHASDSKTRSKDTTIQKLKKGPVPANTTRNWVIDMDIPKIVVRNMVRCKPIDIEYILKVTLVPSGLHMNDSKSWPIIIGSIPLLAIQGNLQNPTNQTHQVQIQYALVNPPAYSDLNALSPLPNPNPIASGNSPYPNPNSPHPNPNSPYPTPNSPYPNPNSPYPTPNSPYPNPNSPYPNPNSPKPVINLPQPGTNPPYPGINLPQPGTNPPYPGINLPQPGTNPPYPNSDSPYPKALPYPNPSANASNPSIPNHIDIQKTPLISAYNSDNEHNKPYGNSPSIGGGLKTGRLGFIGQDSVNMPLLPPGGMPLPIINQSPNPFAGASAPDPSTPAQ